MKVTGNSKLFDFCHYNQVNETIAKENYANKNWAYMPFFIFESNVMALQNANLLLYTKHSFILAE